VQISHNQPPLKHYARVRRRCGDNIQNSSRNKQRPPSEVPLPEAFNNDFAPAIRQCTVNGTEKPKVLLHKSGFSYRCSCRIWFIIRNITVLYHPKNFPSIKIALYYCLFR
jgi:hypothetical protein